MRTIQFSVAIKMVMVTSDQRVVEMTAMIAIPTSIQTIPPVMADGAIVPVAVVPTNTVLKTNLAAGLRRANPASTTAARYAMRQLGATMVLVSATAPF